MINFNKLVSNYKISYHNSDTHILKLQIQNTSCINCLSKVKDTLITKKMVIFKINLFCTTTGYFLPFFSSLLKKEMEEEKENEVAKPVSSSPKILLPMMNY